MRHLQEQIDAAVFDAYGWPRDLTDEEILSRLVELNEERRAEEAKGIVRWLRPEYQGLAAKRIAVGEQGRLDITQVPSATRLARARRRGRRPCLNGSPRSAVSWPSNRGQ